MRHFIGFFLLVFYCGIINAQEVGWHLYSELPTNISPKQLEVTVDGTLFLLTNEREIFYRESDQESWEKVEGVSAWWNHTNIGVNPETNRLFVGTTSNGIRYTDDYGQNWELEYFFTLPTSGLHQSIHSIAYSSDNEMVLIGGGTNPATLSTKVYRSYNNGNSWLSSVSPFGFYKMYVLSSGTILAATDHDGIYQSNTNGTNWSYAGLADTRVKDFAEDDQGNIYTAVNESFGANPIGIFKSEDDGATWNAINLGLGDNGALCIVYDSVGDKLICGTEDGIFEYNGSLWNDISTNLENDPVNDLAIQESELCVGARFFGVYKEESNSNWEEFNQGLNGGMSDYIFNDDDVLYSGYNAIISDYNEEEQSWHNSHLNDLSSSFNRFQKIEKNDDGDIFIFDFNELYRSTDGALSFENITPDLPMVPQANYISFSHFYLGKNGELLLYQTFDNRVYHSTDNGDSFQELVGVDQIPEFLQLTDFVVTEDGRYYIFLFNFGLQKKLLTSVDGLTWTDIDLEPVFQNMNGAGEDLHVMENNSVLFSANHQPYFIDPVTNEFEILPVPWTFETPNAFYNLYSKGLTWTNLEFPQNETGDVLNGKSLKFGPQGYPFIMGTNDSFQTEGLFYFGPEDVFVGIDEFEFDSEFLLYPNPVEGGSVFMQSQFTGSIDLISMTDITGKEIPIEFNIGTDRAEILILKQPAGIYFVSFYSDERLIGNSKLIIR